MNGDLGIIFLRRTARDEDDLFFSRSADEGGTWSRPVKVSSCCEDKFIVVNNDTTVAFLAKRSTCPLFSLRYRAGFAEASVERSRTARRAIPTNDRLTSFPHTSGCLSLNTGMESRAGAGTQRRGSCEKQVAHLPGDWGSPSHSLRLSDSAGAPAPAFSFLGVVDGGLSMAVPG